MPFSSRNPKTMKKLWITLAFTLSVARLLGQTEFTTYDNGLIYSEATMKKLERIVDSLNLKYKSCDLNTTYYAISQTIGHKIRLDSGNIKQARKDINDQIPFEKFVQKYPQAKIDKNVLVIRNKYTNYNGIEKVSYSEIDPNHAYGVDINDQLPGSYLQNMKHSWIFSYQEKTAYSKESLTAFFFPEPFSTPSLQSKYARWVGYSDCLIDTTTAKLRDNAREGWTELPENWQSLAPKEKIKLLEEMRNTRVVGRCSMDNSPRMHAVNIAMLSAETTHWEVFLKAHLDVMNDRFERVTDGSYAWAQRETYIKELEELDINVPDLILGISLRIENPAQHHYYGSIGRLGRAIAESKDKAIFEKEMLDMIADNKLDTYNRLIAYFLFQNYNDAIKNKTESDANKLKLQASIQHLPDYLSKRIKPDRE